jgi:hypothetical protein
MFDGRSRRTAVLLLVPAAVAGASLAGCTSSSSHSGDAALSAKAAAGAFSAAKLRGALLTRVNGVGAAAPVASGNFSALPAAETGRQSAAGQVIPNECARATQTGFNPTGFNPKVLAASPAAAVTFKVATNGVSEELVSSPDSIASTALAGKLPAACAHFKETVDGKTVTYTATESTLTGIGKQARILNLQSSGGSADDLWALVYRGKGFIGAVTVSGPNASQSAVRELGEQAYTYAAKSLS